MGAEDTSWCKEAPSGQRLRLCYLRRANTLWSCSGFPDSGVPGVRFTNVLMMIWSFSVSSGP
eukprot:3821343-Amphidinium_carterae.1